MTSYSDTCSHHRASTRRRVAILDLFLVARQRRHLARLDEKALDDIGLSRSEAQTEANRRLWDVPSHWIK